MDIVQKRFVSGLSALLAVGLGVICCMVLADTSRAAVPLGVNCKPSDGKISGRGATFQEKVQEVFTNLYRDDFCGKVEEQFAADPAGNTMIAYDYPEAKNNSGTGSGAGIKAASCRTDAYAGSDIPYSIKELGELDEAPGKTGGCTLTFKTPFSPVTPYPNENDTTANLMSFPVTGSSVAIAVNLTKKTCEETEPPASLNLNAKEVSRLFGGDIAKWNDAELVATNKGLEKCSGVVTRVVRQDKSGTTNIFKQYLIRAENERTGQKCAEGKKWEVFNPSNNIVWPGWDGTKEVAEGTCSKITSAAKSGGKELIETVKATEGSVGYADLADAVGKGLLLPNVENSTLTSFQAPNAGKAANCTYSVLSLPGSSASDTVGLNSEDNWASNNEEHATKPANHENATDLGAKYPICGITFDLVYEKSDGLESVEPEVTEKLKVVKGLTSTKNILVGGPVAGAKIPVGATVAKIVSETEVELSAAVEGAGSATVKEPVQFSNVKNPTSRLTADQRRTEYSYFTMILSSAGQDVLSSNNYAPLPATWLTKLRTGFQENF